MTASCLRAPALSAWLFFCASLASSGASASSSYGVAENACTPVSGNVFSQACFFPAVPAGSTLQIQLVSWECNITDGGGVPVTNSIGVRPQLRTTPDQAAGPITYYLNNLGASVVSAGVMPSAAAGLFARNGAWSNAPLYAKAGSTQRLQLDLMTMPMPWSVSCKASISGVLTP